MRALPPYDEFELLEESWRLMRVAVEQQVAVGKSHPEVRRTQDQSQDPGAGGRGGCKCQPKRNQTKLS